MDLKLIQRLIRLMKGSGLGELELEDQESGLKLRLKRAAEREASPAPTPMVHFVQGMAPQPQGQIAQPAPAQALAPRATVPTEPAKAAGQAIPSPMIGTFYRSPSPEAEPFVRVGSRVAVDSPLCIIEAMKVMNEIKSEIAGEILEVLVESGEAVEFGQPLFLIKPN